MCKILISLLFPFLLIVPGVFPQSQITDDGQLYSQTDLDINQTSLPSYTNHNRSEQVADDFTASSDWTLNKIVVVGDDIDTNSAAGFNIYIYTNNNGFPGTMVYSAETQPYTILVLKPFIWKVTIALKASANLTAGDYFLSVQYHPVDSTDIGWHWTQVNGSFGVIAKYRSIPTFSSWSPINQYLPTSFTDMYFELYGTSANSNVAGIAEGDGKLPSTFGLNQNYPNPFNPSTNIGFKIPDFGFVSLKVYNVLGKEISTLVNKDMRPGYYNYKFDGLNLPSGIYYYKLTTKSYIETKKMLLLK